MRYLYLFLLAHSTQLDMTAPISSLCTAAASRACYNSRDIISKTANSIVGRCSGINHKRYPTHQIRYITENNDSNKSDGIDRSKFTNEVKVRMPDVGENNEGECILCFPYYQELLKPITWCSYTVTSHTFF